MNANTTWQLEEGLKIIAHFNEHGQPIRNGGNVFNKFCAKAGKQLVYFPLHKSWKKMKENDKNYVWEQQVKVRILISLIEIFLLDLVILIS